MTDSRLDPNSPDFCWQALSDYNDDVVMSHIAEKDSQVEREADETYQALLNDPRVGAAAEFWRDRMKGKIDNYQLEDVLGYYNLGGEEYNG